MVPVVKFTFLCSGGNLTLILSGRFAACLYKIILYCIGALDLFHVILSTKYNLTTLHTAHQGLKHVELVHLSE